MNEVEVPKDRAVSELTLKPAYIDIFSPRIQMLICSFALFAVCIVTMWPTLSVGFLLDDYLHLDYVNRAMHGDWGKFLENFYSNWGGSPIMKSYRPLVSLSLLFDQILFAGKAWGFHLSNIILLWGCSLMVGLTGLELSGLKGNRLGASAAIWAALMFAVYPLHLEASAWIIGRVDLLCTFFYLTSVFCYLRFRLVRERSYFNFSLASFAAAMACKEMAVTLPLVITVAELVLHPLWDERVKEADKAKATRKRAVDLFKFWAVLAVFAAVRQVFLHSLVGGYGTGSLNSFKNF
ncbi:MAG: glycosyltransferase family 39 protein, partial [Candidatus Obscuribacterales bacterium]|nr:glycosyltransferase family 39 protein [Candidatus Obscuribacterales bacterium]